MGHRPLIPILIAFIGGILTAHMCGIQGSGPSLWVISAIAIALVLSFVIPAGLRFPCFLILFFMTGFFLDLSKNQDPSGFPLPERRKKITLEGTVLEPARIFKETAKLVVRGESLRYDGRTIPMKDKILVTVYNHVREFMPGDRIIFPARLRPFKNFQNPGGYDYESAMKIKGFALTASVSDGRCIVPMGRGKLGFPMNIVERGRRPLRDFFRERLSYRNQALLRALILGERQDISPELREPFIIAGLGHVLAVSGLHIGLIAWLFFSFSRRLLSLSYTLVLKTDVRKVAALLTCVPVVAYTCLAGFQVSSQRAMIMVLSYLFSLMIDREKEIWSTLALAAMIVLACDPHALFTVSFQLSFCAVVGILWLAPIIYEKIAPKGLVEKARKVHMERLLTYVAGMIAVTVSTMVFLLPITIYYFHRISLVSIPANLTVVPVLGLWVIPTGLISALCCSFSSSVAGFFLLLTAWGMEWMKAIVGFWADWPWSEIWVITPNIPEIFLFYGFLLSLSLAKVHRSAGVALMVLSLVIAGDVGYWIFQTRFHRHLDITFLDVGQGNAALIQFPGKERMLIDGGGFSRDTFDVGRMVVAPFLLRSKIRRIDYLVLSHPQSDHMNGLRFIASHFHPREFWSNGDEVATPSFIELKRILEIEGVQKKLPGDLLGGREIRGVNVEVFHPMSDGREGVSSRPAMNLNDRSLILRISSQGKSIMFPGDIEGPGEAAFVSQAQGRIKSDVLLAPHHGSRRSSSRAFLECVKPRVCIISCGHANFWGFPHRETLEKLKALGCRIIRTDRAGAVRVRVKEAGLEVDGTVKTNLAEKDLETRRSRLQRGWSTRVLEKLQAALIF